MTIGDINDHSVDLEDVIRCGEELAEYGGKEDVAKLELNLKSLKTRYTILNDKVCYQLGLIKDIPEMINHFYDLHKFIQGSLIEIEKELSVKAQITDVEVYTEV